MTVHSPSLAVFGPQGRKADKAYLESLRDFLMEHEILKPFLKATYELPAVWSVYSTHDSDIQALSHGPPSLQAFSDWMSTGETSFLCKNNFEIVNFPLLLIIQIGQYFQFLENNRVRHADLMKTFQLGAGIQGYCSGLLSAAIVSCSLEETEVIRFACNALRLSVGLGAYADCANTGTSIVMRLEYDGQGEDILEAFPQFRISTITDSRTVTVMGPATMASEFEAYTNKLGLITQPADFGGSLHNPENLEIAGVLSRVCQTYEDIQLPNASCLQTCLRSNITTEPIQQGSLTDEVIKSIMQSQCRWHDVITKVIKELEGTGRKSHEAVLFGTTPCIPLQMFNRAGLSINKIDMYSQETSLLSHMNPKSEYNPPEDAIAIIGMACRFPGASNTEELWNILRSGESRVEKLSPERWNIHESFRAGQDPKMTSRQTFYGNFIAEPDNFDNAFFHVSPREAKYMDPQQRLLLETSYEAVESSGYLTSHRREAGDCVGVFVGASYNDYVEHTAAHPPNAYVATGTIRAFLSGRISHFFGWSGPSEVIDTACSSSLVSVHRARRAIQANECTMALAGGVNIISTGTNYMDLGKAGFLSPNEQCKPFEDTADGYCRADGVGVVVLKRLDRAQADGNMIIGLIAGSATNQGGLSSAITVPHQPSQVSLFREILHQAKMSPNQVSYIEAHGSGTQVGDPVEMSSIREVFGDSHREELLHIGAIKANIGHSETAAGVAGLIKALLMIGEGVLPPLANFRTLNKNIPPLLPDCMAISPEPLQWHAKFRAICVNSYGAAGSNAAVLVCQGPNGKDREYLDQRNKYSYPVAIGAASRDSLSRSAKALKEYLQNSAEGCRIGDVSYTLSRRQRDQRFLGKSTCDGTEALVTALTDGMGGIIDVPQKPKKVVLAFSGQTGKTVGLSRALYESCNLFRFNLGVCDVEVKRIIGLSILPSIFDGKVISNITLLHCNLFAMQYTCAKTWIDSGLKVDAVVGHSFGELTALAVSGILSVKDALTLVIARANLIQEKWGPDSGAMLSINAFIDVVGRIIASSSAVDVEIACYNAEASHVVVGPVDSIALVEEVLKSHAEYQGLKWQKLEVSHGFHSRFTDGLLEDLDSLAGTISFHEPLIFIENCTPLRLERVSPGRISQHTREPVFFHQAIRRLEERLGSCVWLEAGINTPIISMIKKSVARSTDHVYQSIKGHDGQDITASLSGATANLWCGGLSVSYWYFHSMQEPCPEQIWLPPYQFEKSKHWLPYIDHAFVASRSQNKVQEHATDTATSEVYPDLITPLRTSGHFAIQTGSQYFSSILSSHLVLNNPLCPASMYMECVAIAAESQDKGNKTGGLLFESLSFEAPLGIDSSQDVSVVLENDSSRSGWYFLVRSSKKINSNSKSKPTIHGRGHISFLADHDVPEVRGSQIYQRLVESRVKAIAANANTESFKTKKAYGLFSRVVQYGENLRNISLITMTESEAVAEICIPELPNIQKSSVKHICDTISLDTMIQVGGLLINTRDACSSEDAFVATGIENVFVSAVCNFNKLRLWTVYTTVTSIGDSKAVADIFGSTPEGKVLIRILGVHFTKVSFKNLHSLLRGTTSDPQHESEPNDPKTHLWNPMGKDKQTIVFKNDDTSRNFFENEAPVASTRPGQDIASDRNDSSEQQQLTIRGFVAEVSGVPVSDINQKVTLESLGVDSISLIDLKSSLEEVFSIDLDEEVTGETTIGELFAIIGGQNQSSECSSALGHSGTTQGSTDTSVTTERLNRSTDSLKQDQSTGGTNGCGSPKTKQGHFLQTVCYKTVDDLDIHADIYYPVERSKTACYAIGLMVHGGGWMTMSKEAIFPSHTACLLEHNVLPISLDHRLSPEIDIFNGAMTDIRDGLAWAQIKLPEITKSYGINVNVDQIFVIGWSTGGHLAMTTAWTSLDAGLRPPKAILNFYGPSDLGSELWNQPRAKDFPDRSMPLEDIVESLAPAPIASYKVPTSKGRFAGLCPGDPRSELVLGLLKSSDTIPVLLNGIQAIGQRYRPTAKQIASISPLAQLQSGKYQTPTVIVHGGADKVVSCSMSAEFIRVLRAAGVPGLLLMDPSAEHMYDMILKPGQTEWEKTVAPAYDFLLHHLS